MTDDARLPDPLAAARALPRGSLVIARSRERLESLTHALLALGHVRVLVAGDAELAVRLGAAGVHLPEARAREAAHWRARFAHLFISAAAHSLRAALVAHVDAVLLSPVFATESHPGAQTLTPVRASLIAAQARVPVYALGGIEARNVSRLHGFAGIAAIGSLRP